MNPKSITALFLCSLASAGFVAAKPLNDFAVFLEDSRDQEIIALCVGPNGTPHDFAVMAPGPVTLDLTDLPPDDYRLILHSQGYAEQSFRLSYRDGDFVVLAGPSDGQMVLYCTRWVTMDLVWNTEGDRELHGEHVKTETVAAAPGATPPVLQPDYRIVQEGAAGLALRRHRYSNFFGAFLPEAGERFESAQLAPSNDLYDRHSPKIPLDEGDWFFLRISGHRPSTIAYVKVRVRHVGFEPLEGAEVLTPISPTWVRSWKSADDLPERLRILLPD